MKTAAKKLVSTSLQQNTLTLFTYQASGKVREMGDMPHRARPRSSVKFPDFQQEMTEWVLLAEER